MADKMVIRVTHLPSGRVYTSLPEDYTEQDWKDTEELLEKVENLSYLTFMANGGQSKIILPGKVLQECVLEVAMG